MKLKLITAFICIGFMIYFETYGQNNSVNSDSLTLLINKSKIENKNLFLVFGWKGCGWCRVYDKYHNDTIVKGILNKYFIIQKFDIYESESGVELYKIYGQQGTPSWTIFDLNGGVLVDSNNGNGNIGFPAEKKELEYYGQALQKAVPAISKNECEILISKLFEYRERKKQKVL